MSKLIKNSPQQTLHFDVTSGLKSVLGGDLITDDEVAIFELVKNSFDADAKLVQLYIGKGKIVVADNGNGMTYEDIRGKWLKVAYSTKRNVINNDFRDEISNRKYYAGSKGIGRFSSDRLGEVIQLETKHKSESNNSIHSVRVNWNDFDKDLTQRFEKINIGYSEKSGQFDLPQELSKIHHGTVISILETRIPWNRDKILRLKSALAKLINPFGSRADGFVIKLYAPEQVEADKVIIKENEKSGEETPPNTIVNGEVGNFIFSTLQEKTTFIDVKIDQSGKYIETKLTDRGELIYHIREPNEFKSLKDSNFACQVYFLNFSAKMTFARRMGVPSVQFGSVFLFRNGFRVFPVGEEGDDWFGMDRRKQQGYARFLGTRDVIGRIDVSGTNKFEEASSRNTGLKENEAVVELRKCFREFCLGRLEKYVVPVTFGDAEDKNNSDVSRLLTDSGKARVSAAVAKLVDDKNIVLLDYSKKLVSLINERSAQFESSLTNIRAIAEKTKNPKLYESIEKAEKRFQELKASEEKARRQADEERKAKEEAEAKAEAAEQKATQTSEQLDEEKKRNHFLTSISSLDTDTILNLHHQVTIYSVDLHQQIENFITKISGSSNVPTSEVLNVLESIAFLNSKVMGVSKFATKANFRLQSEKIEADVAEYIEQYINGVAKDFLSGSMSVTVQNDQKGFIQKFKPIDVAIVVENLIRNAKKARANKVEFTLTHPQKGTLNILVSDNGRGFDKNITDVNRVFEKGFTTTDGSGLGLYHVRQVLGEMKGSIEAIRPEKNGAKFLIKIAK